MYPGYGNGLNAFSCNVCTQDMVMSYSVNNKTISTYIWADIHVPKAKQERMENVRMKYLLAGKNKINNRLCTLTL